MALSGSDAQALSMASTAYGGGRALVDLRDAGSSAGLSTSGYSGLPSSAGGVTRQELQESIAAAVAAAMAGAQVSPPTPAGAAGAAQLPSEACQFCQQPLAVCKGQCKDAKHAFQLLRQKRNDQQRERREAEAAAAAQGGDGAGGGGAGGGATKRG
jgi:hypothetical protein